MTTVQPTSSDLRHILQEEFVRRCRTNRSYSLRAFAKALRVDSSTLSQFIRGKRKLSPQIQLRLAKQIGLNPKQIQQLASSPSAQDHSQVRAEDFRDLSLDIFQLIADWYHYAIFELITLKDFDPSSRWIARKLGITPTEADAAIARLKRLDLILVNEDGSWSQGAPLITNAHQDLTAAAFRKLRPKFSTKLSLPSRTLRLNCATKAR
jgi:uncharacterized protein (TIGR02147 family)